MHIATAEEAAVGINRIRLEFKVDADGIRNTAGETVLIESDWNLKDEDIRIQGKG